MGKEERGAGPPERYGGELLLVGGIIIEFF
jgi:hypothetical protein